VTELGTGPRRTPAADRYDTDAAALQALIDGDDRMAHLHRSRPHGGSPRTVRHTRQRVPPQLPCQRHDPELWFADAPGDLERAKALCSLAPSAVAGLAGSGDPLIYLLNLRLANPAQAPEFVAQHPFAFTGQSIQMARISGRRPLSAATSWLRSAPSARQ
jgi:hypothetical protein